MAKILLLKICSEPIIIVSEAQKDDGMQCQQKCVLEKIEKRKRERLSIAPTLNQEGKSNIRSTRLKKKEEKGTK